MTRAQRAVEAARLLAQDLNGIQIAQRMGISRTYTYALLNDPDGSGDRARKASYSRPCPECGAPMNGSNGRGPNAAEFCRDCAPLANAIWTREAIILAIQEWADEHGGIPPTATEWRWDSYPYPVTTHVQYRFGTWNAAIEAAGFTSRLSGHYGRDGEDPAVIAETVRLYRSGLSTIKIAALHGCGSTTVSYRLEKAGEPRRHSGWTRSRAA